MKKIAPCLMFFAVVMMSLNPGTRAEVEKKTGFGIALSPSIIRMAGTPGQSQEAKIRVYNRSPYPMRFIGEVVDVGNVLDAEGNLVRQFPPAGTLPHSCGKWILLHDTEIDVEPGTHRDVTFLISSPSDSAGGKSAVIFYRGMPLHKKAELERDEPVTTIQIQPRLGVMLFYDIQGTITRTGKLSDLAYDAPTETSPLKIRYTFKNTGNADILLTGSFYILDQTKALVAKGRLTAVRTFPGDEGSGVTEWPGFLAPANYQLVVTFELGPDIQEVIVREIDFSIP